MQVQVYFQPIPGAKQDLLWCHPCGQWHLTSDYRKLNNNILPLTATVPGITSILTAIQAAAHHWVATVVVTDLVFLVPER